MLIRSLNLLFCTVIVAWSLGTSTQADVYLNAREYQLGVMINEYRVQNSLDPIPVTVSLTDVGQRHVLDLVLYEPDAHPECNLHSWSANGPWTPVCYTADHANAEGMWNKPREITNNVYTGTGYEISYNGQTSDVATILNAWQNSAAHNNVLLSQGVWSNLTWRAMGVGIHEDHANVWFGEVDDPQGLASVPEPASAGLLIPALCSLAYLRRKRKVRVAESC